MHFLVISFISIFLLAISPTCYTYKVLVVSPAPIASHMILNRALVELLLEAGFQVTHITVARHGKFYPNLKQVYVNPKDLMVKPQSRHKINSKDHSNYQFGAQRFAAMLQHRNVNRLLFNTTQTFDLVIAEWLKSSIFSGLAALYGCPLIWFGTAEPHILMFRLVDKNHATPMIIDANIERAAFAKVFEPLLAMRGKPLYSYDQLRSAASLVFVNSHENQNSDGINLWPKKFIPVAGFHVEMNMEPLHKTLKRVMDNAKQGFIYLSFGINIYNTELMNQITNNLLQTFRSLQQTVLWQQEQELPLLPSNVHMLNWSPQQRILSHPNCVLFITNGGGLSVIEAEHFGVPIIGLPIFGDQIMHVDKAVAEGIAKKINVTNLMVDDISNAIWDMLRNPSYREKAKQLSTVYRRQSAKTKKELIYWVNQTIKFNHTHYEDMGPLFDTYIKFKTYFSKDLFNVGIVTAAVLMVIPFSFKLLVLFHMKSRNTSKTKK